jgi:hypothetical protein
MLSKHQQAAVLGRSIQDFDVFALTAFVDDTLLDA